MATLKIKNESGAKLELPTPGGVVSLDTDASADLNEKQLKSPAFADALLHGRLSITVGDTPSDEEIALAKAVLPPVVTGARARLTQLKSRFDQSQAELVKLRDAFNRTWKVAEASLGATKSGVAGWPGLRDAVTSLILDADEEPADIREKREALEAAQKELDTLKSEDLGETGRTLEQWYADRVAKENAVRDAAAALAKVSQEKANPLIADLTAIDARVGAIQAIKQDAAIGAEIPQFGR